MFSALFSYMTNLRSLALTFFCLCGACSEVVLHFFSVRTHYHQGEISGGLAGFLFGIITLALVWIFREHYNSHKKALQNAKGAFFESPVYLLRLWDGQHYYWSARTEFLASDDARFQQAIDLIGFVPTALSSRVLADWSKRDNTEYKLAL